MLRKLALAAAAAVPCTSFAAAQATGIIWPENCSSSVVMTNTTGLPIGSLWLAIENDDLNTPPEIARMVVDDGRGYFWKVDDNEDGDIADGLVELNEMDSTPRGNAEGWHRVQAPDSSEVIRPGQTYRLTLCAQSNQSLKNRVIYLLSVQPGPSGNGDAGVPVAAPQQDITTQYVATLVSNELPPLSAPYIFSIVLTNANPDPIAKFEVTARQTDVDVQNVVSSNHPGVWNDTLSVYVFNTPLGSGDSANLDFELDGLSTMPPPLERTGPQTDVEFNAIVSTPPPTGPLLPWWGYPSAVLMLAAAGSVLLRRRA